MTPTFTAAMILAAFMLISICILATEDAPDNRKEEHETD